MRNKERLTNQLEENSFFPFLFLRLMVPAWHGTYICVDLAAKQKKKKKKKEGTVGKYCNVCDFLCYSCMASGNATLPCEDLREMRNSSIHAVSIGGKYWKIYPPSRGVEKKGK